MKKTIKNLKGSELCLSEVESEGRFDNGSSHGKGGVHVPVGGSFNGRGTIATSVQKVCPPCNLFTTDQPLALAWKVRTTSIDTDNGKPTGCKVNR